MRQVPLPPHLLVDLGRREAPPSGRRRRPERSLYSQGRVFFWVDFTLLTLFTLFTLSGADGAGNFGFQGPSEVRSLRNP